MLVPSFGLVALYTTDPAQAAVESAHQSLEQRLDLVAKQHSHCSLQSHSYWHWYWHWHYRYRSHWR